ncbi:MAG TPA: ParA family protein [Chloroflexota bacterium]
MTIFAVANQKGGVGKTTTVINLGAYLGALGARVLLVDCDPQANTTSGLGQRPSEAGLYDVLLHGVPATEAIVPTSTQGVDLLTASPELAGAEVELLEVHAPDTRLRETLEPLRTAYSYILLDCPPSLGLLTLNALVAAEAVVVPVQCEYLALEGLARLMGTLERIRLQSNPRLRIFGLVMTMYDGRTLLSQQVVDEVRRHYPELTFDTMIPRSIRLSEAPSFGTSILDYDPHSRGAEAYSALAIEVASRAPAFYASPDGES